MESEVRSRQVAAGVPHLVVIQLDVREVTTADEQPAQIDLRPAQIAAVQIDDYQIGAAQIAAVQVAPRRLTPIRLAPFRLMPFQIGIMEIAVCMCGGRGLSRAIQ